MRRESTRKKRGLEYIKERKKKKALSIEKGEKVNKKKNLRVVKEG